MVRLIDKDALLAKIDGEIKLLEPYLGACAGQIVAEANSKIATYNRVKDIINVLEVKEVQEKLVSDDFTKVLAECIHQAQWNVVDPMAHAEIWKDELIKLAKNEEPVSEQNLSNVQRFGKNWKEPVSDDLESEIQRYNNSLNLDAEENYEWDDIASNVIIAARHFAKWQKAKDESTTEDLGEYINELSKQFPEVSFAKLSRIAVRVAKWKKEQMMAKAIDAQCFGFQGAALFSFRLPSDKYLVGSNVKVILINE